MDYMIRIQYIDIFNSSPLNSYLLSFQSPIEDTWISSSFTLKKKYVVLLVLLVLLADRSTGQDVRNQRYRGFHSKAREVWRGQPRFILLDSPNILPYYVVLQVATLVTDVIKQVQEHEPDTLVYYAFEIKDKNEIVIVER